MPSGTATALGDVFTTHGGKTVEVFDTDAEGRLVMCDALELAVDERHDAIIDIATHRIVRASAWQALRLGAGLLVDKSNA